MTPNDNHDKIADLLRGTPSQPPASLRERVLADAARALAQDLPELLRGEPVRPPADLRARVLEDVARELALEAEGKELLRGEPAPSPAGLRGRRLGDVTRAESHRNLAALKKQHGARTEQDKAGGQAAPELQSTSVRQRGSALDDGGQASALEASASMGQAGNIRGTRSPAGSLARPLLVAAAVLLLGLVATRQADRRIDADYARPARAAASAPTWYTPRQESPWRSLAKHNLETRTLLASLDSNRSSQLRSNSDSDQ